MKTFVSSIAGDRTFHQRDGAIYLTITQGATDSVARSALCSAHCNSLRTITYAH